jgi:Dolichyl-phosphate-mannose-protein mannosyltransferase
MKPLQRFDRPIGLGLSAAFLLWIYRTSASLGFCRDESFYFQAASSYIGWFRLLFAKTKGVFEQATVDTYWSANHEHPSLVKSTFALSWMFLHEKWKLIEQPSQALRLPGMVFGAIGVYITYALACRIHSRIAGLAAAFSLCLIPSVFYHAHLACFDVPVMTMWLLAVYTYMEAAHTRTLRSALVFGVAFGLLLETKHNAWLLPGVIAPHALWAYSAASPHRGFRLRFPWPLLAMATVGPLVFFALWPWLWHDTEARLREYAAFHLNHEYYNIEFLGRNYYGPPSPLLYAPTLIAATVPTVTLALFAVGLLHERWALRVVFAAWVSRLRRKSLPGPSGSNSEGIEVATFAAASARLALVLALAVPIAVFFLPKTPIFGGTKHWLPAYPFLCIFAGLGFAHVSKSLRTLVRNVHLRSHAMRAGSEFRWNRLLVAALGVVVFAAPVLETAHSHPFGLSAYVPFAGGTRGGASLGLNRQFWGFTTQSLAPFFAAQAQPGESVFIHDTTGGAWQTLQNEKRMRADLGGNIWSIQDTQWAIVHHELHMIETETNIWTVFGTASPAYVLTHDGVPIISVYKRPNTP